MTRRTRNTLLTITLIAAAVLYGPAVWAQDVEIPIDTILRGDPGDIIPIASIPADAGVECVVVLTFTNPGEEPSIHPGNDILVGPLTFTNVEGGLFAAVGHWHLTTTGPIDVAVRLGVDGVFSAGFTLEITCNPPTTTTTTTPSTPSTTTSPGPVTTTTPTVTVPPVTPTTLSPPPVGPVPAGGGGCADGACDGFSLSLWQTWLGIGVLWALLAGLIWAWIAGTTRKDSGG